MKIFSLILVALFLAVGATAGIKDADVHTSPVPNFVSRCLVLPLRGQFAHDGGDGSGLYTSVAQWKTQSNIIVTYFGCAAQSHDASPTVFDVDLLDDTVSICDTTADLKGTAKVVNDATLDSDLTDVASGSILSLDLEITGSGKHADYVTCQVCYRTLVGSPAQ